MIDGRTKRVFIEMVREEWRLHSRLFRGRHLTYFPVMIGVLSAGTTALLVLTGTDPAAIYAGLHALVFFFGLHTGTIGFVGRDAIQNLLGDLTLLIFSARTLPLSRKRLLGIFVVKDVVYYTALFLAPMSLGSVAAVLAIAGQTNLLIAVGTTILLLSTLVVTFAIGLGSTIAGLGVTSRGVPGLVVLTGVAAAIGGAAIVDIDVLTFTPYGVFLEPTVAGIGGSMGLLVFVFLVGTVAFDPTRHRTVRTVDPSFRRWERRIGDPVATKTLLEVHRSSGGFGKVVFSAAILFVVAAALIDLAGRMTGVAPSVGISFGSILGLTAFTTFNWLTQSDDVASYLVHPVGVDDIFAAKFRAFLALGPIVGLGFYFLAVIWRGSPPWEALVGVLLLVGVTLYIFGTTIYLTGLSPNEFLFDTGLFAVFGVAMIVPLVPILVVGFAFSPVPTPLLVVLGIVGAVIGSVGIILYHRSLRKWSGLYRE